MSALGLPPIISVMARDCSVPCVGLPVVVAALLALAIGSQAADAAKRRGRVTSKAPYTLTVSFVGRATQERRSVVTVGSEYSYPAVFSRTAIARYTARSKRPFYIHRTRSWRRHYFGAAVTGQFTHGGAGSETITQQCTETFIEQVFPGKTDVAGVVSLGARGPPQIGIDITPEEPGGAQMVRSSPCGGQSTTITAPVMPTSEQHKNGVDLRGKFGRDFVIYHEPAAVSEFPEASTPTETTDYEWLWILRFTAKRR